MADQMLTEPNAFTAIAALYRRARNLGYCLLDPFDALFRRINRLGHYPPIHLRRHSSKLGSLDGLGREFRVILKLLLALKSGQHIWDIGCGCGLLELALEGSGWRGPLVGTDIHKPSILWAQRTISRRVPLFRFLHADIYNSAYWPTGKLSAREWFSRFPDTEFDVIVAKSLFTHMLPDELDIYLQQVGLRLKPTGKALFTFFLLNQEQQALKTRNRPDFIKPAPNAVYAIRSPIAPSAAVAYEESHVLQCLESSALRLADRIYYGWWTGRRDTLGGQDIVIVTKRQ